jgi:hypothetical protein
MYSTGGMNKSKYHLIESNDSKLPICTLCNNNEVSMSTNQKYANRSDHAVYISREIWNLPLSTDARCLLAHIVYYVERYGECTSSNSVIKTELQCGDARVKTLLNDLETQGYIVVNKSTYCPPLWSDEKPVSHRKISPGGRYHEVSPIEEAT